MTLRDRNGSVPDFEVEHANLYREALARLDEHYPESQAAIDTRKLVKLLESAEELASGAGLRSVWRGIGRDLNNNICISTEDGDTRPAVDGYEARHAAPLAPSERSASVYPHQ